jgi:H/ACA ribonucleoprotein complex subunit 4
MIKKGDLDKYGAKIPGQTPKEWTEGYVDYKEDGVVTFGGSTIATQPQASSSTPTAEANVKPTTATVTEVAEMQVDDVKASEDKKEKKRKRKSEAAGDGDKTVDGEDGEKEKKKVSKGRRFHSPAWFADRTSTVRRRKRSRLRLVTFRWP